MRVLCVGVWVCEWVRCARRRRRRRQEKTTGLTLRCAFVVRISSTHAMSSVYPARLRKTRKSSQDEQRSKTTPSRSAKILCARQLQSLFRGTTASHARARYIVPARLRPRTGRAAGPRPCRKTSSLRISPSLLRSLRSKLPRNADVAGSRLTLRITALASTSNRGKTNETGSQ